MSVKITSLRSRDIISDDVTPRVSFFAGNQTFTESIPNRFDLRPGMLMTSSLHFYDVITSF